MNILIATGIYPPMIGGPAKYAQNLKEEWEKGGHMVRVRTYIFEHKLPSGIRHLYYFLKIIPDAIWSDFVIALDTFSVGMPSVFVCRLLGKKILLRTGGDFLWEEYCERTGEKVFLRDFYNITRGKWSLKEKIIFKLTKWTLHNVTALIFSTQWQRDIFTKAYDLDSTKIYIVENYYGSKLPSVEPTQKNFIAGTRKLKWKNLGVLEEIFRDIPETFLDVKNYSHEEFMKKMRQCYATILVSLGDISPNMILESIRFNKPFIITRENGLMNRIKDIAIVVDPKNENEIKEKVRWLLKKENYDAQVAKIKSFSSTHEWPAIAREFLEIYKKI